MSNLTQSDWPQFSASRHTPRGSRFRIGTRKVFVDMPNGLINSAISKIHSIEDKNQTPESAYETIQSELDEINELVRRPVGEFVGNECDWIEIQVHELPYAKKPYNIQVRTDWDKHLEFLGEVANDPSINFTEKYEYIFNCRNIRLLPKQGEPWITDSEKEKVKEFASEEIAECREHLFSLNGTLEDVSKKCRQKELIELFYLYSKDCLHSLQHIEDMLEAGRIAPCYRELRNLVEELTVAVFYDKVTIEERNVGEPYSLPIPENDWFLNARDCEEIFRSLRDLKRSFSDYIESINNHSPESTSKSRIWNLIVDNLNVSLFIVAASTDTNISELSIEPETREEIVRRASKITEMILKEALVSDSLSDREKIISEKITRGLLSGGDELWIKFPTGFFTRGFVGKLYGEDLNQPYNRYSHFVHSYPDSWQVSPASSILEYKLFTNELSTITGKVNRILKTFHSEV